MKDLTQLIKEQGERVREEWKCTCDDCGHINDIYDMEDLCNLVEETAEAVRDWMVEMVEGMKEHNVGKENNPFHHRTRYNQALKNVIAKLQANTK